MTNNNFRIEYLENREEFIDITGFKIFLLGNDHINFF